MKYGSEGSEECSAMSVVMAASSLTVGFGSIAEASEGR